MQDECCCTSSRVAQASLPYSAWWLLWFLCRVVCDVNGKALEPLLARPPAGLRGLTISGLCLQQSFVEQLAGLTNLTLLQLVGTCVNAGLGGGGGVSLHTLAMESAQQSLMQQLVGLTNPTHHCN